MPGMKALTCREFDEVVHGFVRMELLDVNVHEAVLEHAAHCTLCAERMAAAGAIAEASVEARNSAQNREAPPRVEAALRVAFRTYHGRRRLWRRTFEWAAAGAAAAMLVVFLWSYSGRSKQPPSPAPRKDVTTQPAGPLDAARPIAPNLSGKASTAETEGNTALARETYSPSDFVPVPFAGGITPDDPGMIVRVQLTRASLAQLGYPVAGAPDGDLVQADVLVGEDGWPRGVKLVQDLSAQR